MNEKALEMQKRRDNFMEQFKDDVVLAQTIPGVAKELFYEEFGISIDEGMLCTIPITFFIGWKQILKFVGNQPSDEFSFDVCGISLEYVTEYSESDKLRNIVPQLIHKKTPIFTRDVNVTVPGYRVTDELLAKYNNWRSVNLCEIVDKIENSVKAEIMEDYGIDLMVSAAVLPMMSAAYAAGLQIARETKKTVNMYNIFEIDIVEGDQVVLTPLAIIKQYLKNDAGHGQ